MYKWTPWQGQPGEQLSPWGGMAPIWCCLGHSLAASGGASTSLALVQALGRLQGKAAMDLN